MLLAKTLGSTTLRLAFIAIGVFGIALFALFGYVYWSTTSFVLARSDRAIAADYEALRETYDHGGRDGVAGAIRRRLEAPHADRAYLLAGPDHAPIAGNFSAWPARLSQTDGWREFQNDAGGTKVAYRARYGTLPNGDLLLVAADIDDLDQFVARIKAALGLTLALIFVLAGFVSISITRRTVGRIEGINAISRAIMESGLGQRIALRGTNDEWDQLAHNLNTMLDRIELLMGEVKQVTDNVAHDLRTPLTRIYARLEKARNAPRDSETDRALITDLLAELDGVLRMFSSLMRISRIETSDRMAAFHGVDVTELARAVADLFDAAAEVKGTRLEVSGAAGAIVRGDRDLLFDALANLVDNAIKHGREAGRVDIDVRRDDNEVAITVGDDGPGIPADELPNVFTRFYRLERSRRTPGNGLGLSLVAAVARLHGARIELVDNVPGLTVRLHFPSAADSTPAAEVSALQSHVD